MPRNRKASVSSGVTRVEIQPTADHLDVTLRRSTRHRVTANRANQDNKQQETDTETTHHVQGQGLALAGPKVSSGDSADSIEAEQKSAMARKGVRQAIEGLAKMERDLIKDTKQQKIRIKESNFTAVRPDNEEERAFKPDPVNTPEPELSQSGSIPDPTRHKHLPTPEREFASSASDDQNDEGGKARYSQEPQANDAVEVEGHGAARPPAVNSDYLPLPWKGRLGYACLNTYLRAASPPVFSSRTCRLASIIEHRYPLQDPSLPEHPTKNRPDKTLNADNALGLKFVQNLGLQNARDITTMLRWNDKYGIKFMRLSSEMFPFASHEEHGYKLAPFASEVLREAGQLAAKLGHRLTTHPGQFTQIGSPRKEVVTASVRDLEYHDELLSLLRLPEQQDRDAVMILHMGGVYGDKAATLNRFRQNYTKLLSASVKARLVLENDDVSWSVHDLLPICEELNIPLVLDFHHHNIVFDATQVREGTYDISQPAIMDRIAATWKRKKITQKMHYSEPCAGAVTPRDRRKHSPRVASLPPCAPNMDLMIEAKDKEQAVFQLMRTYKLPGYETINDVVPYVREDENRAPPVHPKAKKKPNVGRRRKRDTTDEDVPDPEAAEATMTETKVSTEDFGMGGLQNRVFWPLGMEHWLKPRKRLIKKRKDTQ